MKVLAPLKCRACMWQPNEEEEKTVDNAWIAVNIPGTPIFLHVCPNCGMMMPQDNLVEMVAELEARSKSRIVQVH